MRWRLGGIFYVAAHTRRRACRPWQGEGGGKGRSRYSQQRNGSVLGEAESRQVWGAESFSLIFTQSCELRNGQLVPMRASSGLRCRPAGQGARRQRQGSRPDACLQLCGSDRVAGLDSAALPLAELCEHNARGRGSAVVIRRAYIVFVLSRVPTHSRSSSDRRARNRALHAISDIAQS